MKKILLPFLLFLTSVGLVNAQNYHVNEDFNGTNPPTGWTNNAVSGSTAWSFGIDGSVTDGGNNNLDGTTMAYFDDDALGGSSLNNTAELITPAFNNSTNAVTTLEFDYNARFFNGISDAFNVDVFDGTNWVNVLNVTVDDCGRWVLPSCQNNFPHAVIDISQHANANCRVRFRYTDGNDWGWYVGLDNVQIFSPFPNDLQVTNVLSPESGCGLTSTDTVSVVVKNIGTSSASNFNIAYAVNGGTPVSETVTSTLSPNDSLVYTFTNTVNLSTIGSYDIDAFSQLTGDGNTANDTTSIQVSNDPSYSPTYSNDFETSNTGWVIYGTNASWALGTPAPLLPSINSAASGVQTYATNLVGTYNNNELSYLESPCFDFGSSIGDPIMTFSINYDTESGFDRAWMEYSIDNGLTWNKLPAGPNPTNWYNNTTDQVWEGQSGGWITVENILAGLQGQTQAKFRMVFNSDGSTLREGVGFDKFAIRDPQAIDLSANALLYPSSTNAPLCGFGSNENIILQVENKGANPISSYDVSYQVDGGTIFTETVNAVLPPNARLNYTFSNKFNFSALRNYSMRVWVNVANDGFTPNDSIENITVSNTQNVNAGTIPYFENFDAFPEPNLINGWTTTTGNSNFYRWESQSGGTPSGGTGPTGGHSGQGVAGNGVYIYTEASSGFGSTSINLTSPCFDLSNNSGAKLIFWYHKHGGQMGDLFVDVYDGANWINGVDRIAGETHPNQSDNWLEREVSLNVYAGRRIKIRFRGMYAGGFQGDMAIDDVQLFEPLPKDANLLGPVGPVAGCAVSDSSIVQVEVNNFGSLSIQPDSMFLYYQVDNLPPVKDTFDQILPTEQTTVFTFTQAADLSVVGKKYNIKTWVELIDDPNQFNDTVFNYQVINNTRTPNFGENMETFRDADCAATLGQVVENGWIAEEGQYMWHVQKARCGQGDLVTPTAGTGPNGDHTTPAGTGYFMYTDPSAATSGPTVAQFTSPCIDLTNDTAAEMSFWYHKFGFQCGNLTVQASSGGAWTNLLTIPGQTQSNASAAWKIASVDLSAYAGNLMQVRFVGTNGGQRGNMAIDDIYLYRPSSIDVGVTEIVSPSGDNCTLPTSSPVTVKVKNFGSQTIPANSVQMRYLNNNAQLTFDTIPQSIAPGAEVTFTFGTNMDISEGGEQLINVYARTNGDTLTENNVLSSIVVNRRVGFPYYFQDFERFKVGNNYGGDDLKSWSRFPNGSNHTWHVWQGNAPTMGGEPLPPPPIPPNGPSGDHTFATDRQNGDGLYMLTETKFRPNPPASSRPDAWLKFPCSSIDFSQSVNGKILLSFWYHMFGANMGDLFIDVYNGSQWINGVSVIRGVQMAKATDQWREWQVILDNFSGISNADIRFRAELTQNVGGGDMGIDDVTLLDRATVDVTTKALKRPESDCDLSNRERIRVEVQNTGTTDILQLNMGYQITHIGLDNVVTVRPIVRDSAVGALIVPYARYTHEFTDREDFSLPGKYEIKMWAENDSDQYAFNDTIFEVIENTTQPFPSCVDFSRLLYGDKGPDYQDELLPNNWTTSQGASYAWTASLRGPGETGGPVIGNTSGVNDLYMLLAGGMPGQTAWMQSSCFDLTTTRAANLTFFYQATSPNHEMYIQAREVGGAWQDLDTLRGFGITSVASWQKVELVLADFLGNFVEFRFFAINPGGGYYAIDDVCVVSPPNQQIELEQIYRPRTGLCYYSDQEDITVRVQNVGNDRIDSFRVILAVDTVNRQFPLGQYQRDTFWIYPTNPLLEPGLKLDFTLDSTVDMSHYVEYFISALVYLPGDIDTTNNRIVNKPYIHGDPRDLPYFVDFEDPVDPLNGMLVFNALNYGWGLFVGQATNAAGQFIYQGLTGPLNDHTFQDPTGTVGTYITSLSDGGAPGDLIAIQSECIDLQNSTSPEMSYWYHMVSTTSEMGNLFLQINDDFGWVTVDSLKGSDPDQNFQRDPWKERKVDLSAYAGDVVKFRFLSFRGGDGSNMALDDIAVYDLAPTDIAATELVRPNDDIWSCYTDTQTVRVSVRNNGSDSIKFSVDTLNIRVDIEKDGVPWDTLYRQVDRNIWSPIIGNPPLALPKDSIVIIEMDGNFDMSDIGSEFKFTTTLFMASDPIPINNVRADSVVARRDSGTINSNILPNDTVCYGTPVKLTLENYFGALKWQEKELDANGNGFWFDGFSFPNDSANYVVVLDTTTELRVQVCRQVESLPVTVEIIKPYQGEAIHNSNCGPGNITLGLITPPNITEVRLHKTDTSSVAYNTMTTPSNILPNGNQEWNFTEFFARSKSGFDTTYTVWAETMIDSCVTLNRLPIYASVNRVPGNTRFRGQGLNIFVCQDTAAVLDAGTQPGRKYTYDWTITNPDGSVDFFPDTLQTLIVDGWKYQVGDVINYSVVVTTDSGCVNLDNNGNPRPVTGIVTIEDSCVTSIANYEFGDEFNIFPNPTNNDLFIEYRSLDDLNGRVSLISMDGKLIEQRLQVDFRRDRTKFNLGDLPKGIYFIRIETEKGSIVRKVVRS